MRFGIFIYDGVEPIDLATFGVLSMARRIEPRIEIVTIAPKAGPVALSNGLQVIAQHGIGEAPACTAVIVTGGPGWIREAENLETQSYFKTLPGDTLVASVCTGAMILAASGTLDGLTATTKREVVPPEEPPVDVMRRRYPGIKVADASLVDTGRIVTGGGVSLCIDTTLHLLARVAGKRVADETARILEYSRALEANRSLFPPVLLAGA